MANDHNRITGTVTYGVFTPGRSKLGYVTESLKILSAILGCSLLGVYTDTAEMPDQLNEDQGPMRVSCTQRHRFGPRSFLGAQARVKKFRHRFTSHAGEGKIFVTGGAALSA